jgi:hypothetical protein
VRILVLFQVTHPGSIGRQFNLCNISQPFMWLFAVKRDTILYIRFAQTFRQFNFAQPTASPRLMQKSVNAHLEYISLANAGLPGSLSINYGQRHYQAVGPP